MKEFFAIGIPVLIVFLTSYDNFMTTDNFFGRSDNWLKMNKIILNGCFQFLMCFNTFIFVPPFYAIKKIIGNIYQTLSAYVFFRFLNFSGSRCSMFSILIKTGFLVFHCLSNR